MNPPNPETTVPTSTGWFQIWRLVGIGMLMPLVIAVVNYTLLGPKTGSGKITPQLCLQFVGYILEIGVMGYVVGKGIPQAPLRWLLLGWTLLIVNLLNISVQLNDYGPQNHVLSAELFSGQLGLCVVWATLGDGRWPVRWSAMLLTIAGLWFLWFVAGRFFWFVHEDSQGRRFWGTLLAIEALTAFVLCGALRLRGYQLVRWGGTHASTKAIDSERPVMQFNLKDMLIWATVLSMLLVTIKGLHVLDWFAHGEYSLTGLLWKLTIAFASSIAIIVALWVALGREPWFVRYPLGSLMALAIGFGLSKWSLYNAAYYQKNWLALYRAAIARGDELDYDTISSYDIGWWWLIWIFLGSGLLAATLIILRTLQYRLVRVQPSQKLNPPLVTHDHLKL